MRERSVKVRCSECGRICAGVESQIYVGRYHVRRHKNLQTSKSCFGYLTHNHPKIEAES